MPLPLLAFLFLAFLTAAYRLYGGWVARQFRLDDARTTPAVRVNDQYRIVFRFEGADAFDVRCTDYH